MKSVCLLALGGVVAEADPEQPHLAQAWTALSKGDGLPNTIGQESYVWAEKNADRPHTIKAHWYKYDDCQKLSLHDPNQLHHIQGGERNYYLKCDSLDCCYSDFSMKQWDIGTPGPFTTTSFVAYEDTTELNDNPVSQAEHWHEENKLLMTPYKVTYDHFISRGNDTDIISHRINYGDTGNLTAPGEILYANFQVQHDVDAFIQKEFQLPEQCNRNNLLKCGDGNVRQWEAKFFKHDHAMKTLQEAAESAHVTV
jgi:hypothetical protein